MRKITVDKIRETVRDLCIQANLNLRKDILAALKKAYSGERNKRAKNILSAIIDNAYIAQKEKLAICQDTGLPTVFLGIGKDVKIEGDLKSAVNKGVEEGYRKGCLRNSIIRDPLARGRPGYSPAVIHTDIVKGNRLKITVLPKGFGCENKTQLKMFNPTAKISEIKKFIIDAVRAAGPDACPPYIVGVGIGGTADYAMFLAKRALLRKLYAIRYTHFDFAQCPSAKCPEPVEGLYAKLESDLLKEINKLNIGPMGLGGKTTCLGVKIETYPTHIAGLPVAVNISCHALRSATKII